MMVAGVVVVDVIVMVMIMGVVRHRGFPCLMMKPAHDTGSGVAIFMCLSLHGVSGWFKSLAAYIFSAAQILTLFLALHAILRRDIARHRAWMIRAFAIGLAVSTMRAFFIPAYFLFGIPNDFTIGLGMWVGFLVNIAAAECLLWRERVKSRA